MRSLCQAAFGWCVAVLLCLSLRSTTAQLTQCFYQGYNLTALTGSDLYYDDGADVWAIHPCGVVTNSSFCTDTPGGGEFCQGNITLSTMNVSAAVYPPNRGALWAQLEINGQYGVTQFLQDGTYCNAIQADREGTIIYVCNATATTPYISNITSQFECHYQAIIQTAIICPQLPPNGFSTSNGTNFLSAQCGAGIYNLSVLGGMDIVSAPLYDTVVDGLFVYVIRVCNTSAVSQCGGVSSVCQYTPNSDTGFTLALWEPDVSPVIWQYFNDGSMSVILQDGAGCGASFSNRVTNITFSCNATALTPNLFNMTEGPQCTYNLYVETNLVCGAAFADFPPVSSSSSSSSSTPFVTALSSSSTGLSVISSSSSVTVSTGPAGVIGDPQFVGLLGQSYQVHGIDGAVYSLISEQAAQVNARFAFLTGPRPCPAVQPSIACWSHDGSYLSELGLFTPSARLFIRAGPAATGFAAVELNGTTTELSYEQLSSHRITVTLGSFSLSIDNSDGFVNLAAVTALKPLSQLASHGLLGQTHMRAKSGSSGLSGVIEGEVDDYVVEGGLFAVDSVYNRYGVAEQ